MSAAWQVSEGLNTLGATCAQQMPMGQAIGPDTVSSLIEMAHVGLNRLAQEVDRLGEMLRPVRSPIPSQVAEQKAHCGGEPEIIGLLQEICDRISQQSTYVSQIGDELRI